MSHHGNDLAYEQRQELYWKNYDRLIEEGYPVDLAEDLSLAAVKRDIEKSEYIREEQEWDAREE